MTTITSATDATASANGAVSKLNADFNMFLKLLTAQMQNQDPLDPMDTSEYTQQLVQYSQVEQSIAQGATLKSILAAMTTQDLTQASGLIGREAVFDSDLAGLSADAPATWGYSADRPVTRLTATITTADGTVVTTRDIDGTAREGRFEWDGKLANGATAPAGAYALAITAKDAAGNNVPVTITSRGLVREVSAQNGAVALGVNGVTIPASALIRIGA